MANHDAAVMRIDDGAAAGADCEFRADSSQVVTQNK